MWLHFAVSQNAKFHAIQLWEAQGHKKGEWDARKYDWIDKKKRVWFIWKCQFFICCLHAFITIAFFWNVSLKIVSQIQFVLLERKILDSVNLLPYPSFWMRWSILSASKLLLGTEQMLSWHFLSQPLSFWGTLHAEPVQKLSLFSWLAPPWN